MLARLLRALAALTLLTYAVGATASAAVCVQDNIRSAEVPAMPADCPDNAASHECVTACGSTCLALADKHATAEHPRIFATAAPELVPAILRDWNGKPEPPPPRGRSA